ncbi:hypothetical protein JB92DRAFT_3083104 [Gautieria morchelliformis]|nr:hypothetical protein JB92DRAFT_3083104 [Gautieria morchelliformis]
MAVMDGKTMIHRICAVKDCRGALMNYWHGRFCEAHIGLATMCGVDGCKAHPQGVEVPPGDPVANLDLGHTFHARHIYCLQTLQWACSVPIGFGKCYGSESTPQVRPAFMCYDNACSLLRHMARQNIDDPWLDSTRFIVDAWHYINHQPADLLCRTRCNPSPRNGSQPDHAPTRQQLNAWLDGFEAQLRQMSDFNYDFTVQVALMLYKEKREREIASKGLPLLDEP